MFIQVTTKEGKEILININEIKRIDWVDYMNASILYLRYPTVTTEDKIWVQNTYIELIEALKNKQLII